MSRLIAPLLIVLLVGLAILSLRGGQAMRIAANAAPEQPRYIVRGAQLQSYDEAGQIQFQGQAENIDYFDDESARMRTFEVSVLGGRGAPWTASAPEAFAPAGERHRLQLLGGVEGAGRWPDGEALRFKTESLWVNTATQTLDTEAAVQLDSATRKAAGVGLAVRSEPLRIALLHQVEMRYAAP